MIIVLVGPPFSGKETQAKLLSERFNIPTFSMGKLIREAYKAGNPKAVEGFTNYSLKGLHLPIALKFDLLKEKISGAKNGFILENFPATKEDLDAFIRYAEEYTLSIDKVFHVDISREEMRKRMALRSGRQDDNPEIVIKRLEIQDKDRIPVIEYFRNKGILEEINGERSVPEVHQDILSRLGMGRTS